MQKFIAGVLLSALANPALALTISELVTHITATHPSYLAATERTLAVRSEVDEADAQFDPRVTQQSLVRTSGYYDGRYAEQQIIRPIRPMNGEVSLGYRISDGRFPVYEDRLNTLNGGEISLGVKLALLKDRSIDSRRANLETAALRYSEVNSEQDVTLNAVIYQGITSYLDWLRADQKRAVIEDLLLLTKDRLAGVTARVQSGDLAAVALSELETTLLQRQLLLIDADRELAVKAENLRFFWPHTPTLRHSESATLRALLAWPYRLTPQQAATVLDDLESHPTLRKITAKIDQTATNEKLARNQVLPELDLEFKVAKDIGGEINPLSEGDAVVGLSFSMPIGQRAARARQQTANANLRSLELEKLAIELGLKRDIHVGLESIVLAKNAFTTSQRMEQVAQELLRQETKRFEEGISDQFLLINRETAALEARLSAIEAEFAVLHQELFLAGTLARLSAL